MHLGELSGPADLKPGRSARGRLSDWLFGAEAPPQMVNPMGLCSDGAGRLFVADSHLRLVHVFNLRTRGYEQWRPPEDLDRFQMPVAVAWDPGPQGGRGGRLLVADSAAGALLVFDGDGGLLGSIGDDRLARPVGIAVDGARGRIYVADAGAHHVAVFSARDELLMTFGRRGAAPGEFNYPTYLALDGAGNLYISDSLNFRVQKLDPSGRPLLSIGQQGDMPGYFSQPKGVAVDRGGGDRLYVVDANFEAVQVFDADGALLMTFGQEGAGAGEFWLPSGITVDEQGRIWVADGYNGRVQAFGPLPPQEEAP